jgi:hypothetical protein
MVLKYKENLKIPMVNETEIYQYLEIKSNLLK